MESEFVTYRDDISICEKCRYANNPGMYGYIDSRFWYCLEPSLQNEVYRIHPITGIKSYKNKRGAEVSDGSPLCKNVNGLGDCKLFKKERSEKKCT